MDELREVISVSVEIVAFPCLAGPAVAAAVVRNAAESMRSQEEHLIFKRVCGEWPPMTEHYGLARSPVFVEEFRSVFRSYPVHMWPLSL
jgi:hypothetical protein